MSDFAKDTNVPANDCISRAAAIDALKEEEYPCESDYDKGYMSALKKSVWIMEKWLPSAQPYTEAEIQKMQELEQAELQKAYECGRASAQPGRKTGKWSVEFSPAYKGGAYCECSQCNYKFAMGAYFEPDEWKFCPYCGADMRGEQDGSD